MQSWMARGAACSCNSRGEFDDEADMKQLMTMMTRVCTVRSTIMSMTTSTMAMRARISAMSRTEKSMKRSILLLATV